MIVLQENQIVDVNLSSTADSSRTAGLLSPVVGVEQGTSIEYDDLNQILYWVEVDARDEDNVSSHH
jgi:hypothetical protein